MEVIIDDKVIATKDDKVVVDLSATKYKSAYSNNKQKVAVSDTYQLVPYAKRITVDYQVPASITEGQQVQIDDLREDLLAEIGDRELADINYESYSNVYSDGLQTQQYIDLESMYMGQPGSGIPGAPDEFGAYILSTNLGTYDIEYDMGGITTIDNVENMVAGTTYVIHAVGDTDFTTLGAASNTVGLSFIATGPGTGTGMVSYTTVGGTTTANFQEINDRVVNVENSQASYTENLQIHVDNTAASAQRTTVLEASIEDVTVSVVGDDLVEIDNAGSYTASTSKMIIAPNGGITGWSAVSAQDPDNPYPSSEFLITADNFKIVASNQDVAVVGADPIFETDALTGTTKFLGRVEFGSLDDVPPLVAENTNINTIANIVPTLMWYTEGHADYTFVGSVVISNENTVSTNFVDATATLEVGDEVYSPYIEEMALYDYHVAFSFKGNVVPYLYEIDDTIQETPITSSSLIIPQATMDLLDDAKWYAVEFLVNTTGTTGTTFGQLIDPVTLSRITTIPDIDLLVSTDRFLLGFEGPAVDTASISRVVIEVMGDEITAVDNLSASDIGPDGATIVDGGRITTGIIQSHDTNTYFNLDGNQIKMDNGTGFILDSTAAGTAPAPNIQGGYIKGTTIDGVSIIGASIDATTDITAPTVYGNTFRILTDYIGNTGNVTFRGFDSTIVSNGYTTGHLTNRVCSATTSVRVSATGVVSGGNDGDGGEGVVHAFLEVSIDGGTYSILRSITSPGNGYSSAYFAFEYILPYYDGSRTWAFRTRTDITSAENGFVASITPSDVTIIN